MTADTGMTPVNETPAEAENNKPQKEKKPKKPRRSSRVGITWKLIAYLSAFIFIIITLLWLCQVVFLDTIYKTVKTGEIKAAAIELTRAVAEPDTLADTAATVAERNEVCILVLSMENDDTATRVVSAEWLDDCVIHNIPRYEIFTLYDNAVAHDGKYLEHFRFDKLRRVFYSVEYGSNYNSDDEESIVYSVITSDPDGKDTLILLNSVISPVTTAVKTLNIMLYAIAGVLLLFAVVLSFVLARRISRPIEKINEAAKKLAAGDYGADFSGRGYKEISELGDTLKYAAGELSKVDSLRRELIANISHDLRTPLTMIAGYAEIMRDLPGELSPENAQIIIDESTRLSSLVSDVLDISKLESGVQGVTIEKFNLTETVRDTLTRYNRLKDHDGYQLSLVSDEDVYIESDKTRLMQAFCNLVNNALTYTGADKKVTVTQNVWRELADGRKKVRLSVTDSGDGIAPELLPLIWERYYKVNSPHKRAAVGTGLGLSIVKNIMDLLGGTCGVKSEVGCGSTFWIELYAAE